MATVLEVVTGALKLLEVRTAESPVTPSEAQDGLESLNDLMNEWNIDGINVGYESLSSTTDELHVDLGSIGAIKANLAVYIAPEYGRFVTPTLQMRADRSKKSMRNAINMNPSQYPDTLPIGSGNEGNQSGADGDTGADFQNSHFYPQNQRRQCS